MLYIITETIQEEEENTLGLTNTSRMIVWPSLSLGGSAGSRNGCWGGGGGGCRKTGGKRGSEEGRGVWW